MFLSVLQGDLLDKKNQNYKEIIGDRQIAPLAKYLMHKHEVMSSNPSTHEKLGTVVRKWELSTCVCVCVGG